MSEITIPLTLTCVASVIYVGLAVESAGPAGGVITVVFLLLQALITSVLGLAACFLTAQVLGTSFGALGSACLKLTAVALFPIAAGMVIALFSPNLAVLAVICLYFGLLRPFFELEILERIVFVLLLWSVEAVAKQSIQWI